MNRILLFACFWCPFFFSFCTSSVPPRVLIFSKTTGFRHQSIAAGKDALVKICYDNGILADTTENATFFNEKNLKRYAAVVFLNTNGEVLDPRQEADFERYIQAGGGFVGVHAASATEYTWRWYGGLLGAYFKDHPAIQDISLQSENCGHPANDGLPCPAWPWKEELYNFRHLEPDLQVLLSVDENTYRGGSSPKEQVAVVENGSAGPNTRHALAWCHEYDGGRAFYTALGHIPESYSDPIFRKHLLNGLKYAIGENKPLRYERCRSLPAPDPTRFEKNVVASNLREPMEIAQFPDGKIILIERHGHIKLFNPNTSLLNTVTKLPVYSEMGDGLLGVAIDPQWEKNHWIYLYYSSLRDSMNQLSRFVFQGDTLDHRSEKVLLTIPVGHLNCFHAAGSLTFDPAGNLYLSTGDNTSPFASDGFAPIDEQPGRKAFDAQRSAANTNDLRGKILRIKPLPEGGYVCPKGNLFVQEDTYVAGDQVARPAEDQSGTRPEIYVMGCRNPFRISYDNRRNLLFWGEIGPDAGKTDTTRGPMGHDEINRTGKAGFFGWPYFTADNQAYRDYDYARKKAGSCFDPQHPENASPNNTGRHDLPPAQPAFIWYPYGKNREFPIAGSGGRNAMAGPVYYCDQYPPTTRFPGYYDGKLIIYDWMRNWLMAVTLDSLGNFYRLEPFADSVRLSRPMDMLIDKNGSLWLLEYGTRWYSSNEDARLSRIDFVQGNRPPIPVLEADKTAAGVPCEVKFDCSKTKDYDGGKLTLELSFGDGTAAEKWQMYPPDPRTAVYATSRKLPSGEPRQGISHVFAKPGEYEATLKATDQTGVSAITHLKISVGNEPPRVAWDLNGRNRSFYRPGDTLHYFLRVTDREDGSWENGSIAPAAIATSVEYLEKGVNPATLIRQSAVSTAPESFAEGKRLVDQSDCKSCHAVDRQVNGPAFQAIAARYRSNVAFAVPTIYRKIIYGGSGNWGQSIMIPHPNVREEEAIQMALWILSLGDPPKPVQSLPLAGAYVLDAGTSQPHIPPGSTLKPPGAYVFRAAYRDRGQAGLPRLEGSETLILRPATLQAEKCDIRSEGVGDYRPSGNDTVVLNELKHNAYFAFRRIDLTGVRTLTLRTGYGDPRYPYAGGRMEIRAGSPHGTLLSEVQFSQKNGNRMYFEEQEIPLSVPSPGNLYDDLYFIFRNEQDQGRGIVALDWIRFNLEKDTPQKIQ